MRTAGSNPPTRRRSRSQGRGQRTGGRGTGEGPLKPAGRPTRGPDADQREPPAGDPLAISGSGPRARQAGRATWPPAPASEGWPGWRMIRFGRLRGGRRRERTGRSRQHAAAARAARAEGATRPRPSARGSRGDRHPARDRPAAPRPMMAGAAEAVIEAAGAAVPRGRGAGGNARGLGDGCPAKPITNPAGGPDSALTARRPWSCSAPRRREPWTWPAARRPAARHPGRISPTQPQAAPCP